jgi:hypothetical protein
MKETLTEANGWGSLPAGGYSSPAVIIDTGDQIIEMVNPSIIFREGENICDSRAASPPREYGMVRGRRRSRPFITTGRQVP